MPMRELTAKCFPKEYIKQFLGEVFSAHLCCSCTSARNRQPETSWHSATQKAPCSTRAPPPREMLLSSQLFAVDSQSFGSVALMVHFRVADGISIVGRLPWWRDCCWAESQPCSLESDSMVLSYCCGTLTGGASPNNVGQIKQWCAPWSDIR